MRETGIYSESLENVSNKLVLSHFFEGIVVVAEEMFTSFFHY